MKYKNAVIESIDGDFEENTEYSIMRGLKIETSKGTIKLMIGDESSCCESWDALFFETPDNVDKFVGAKILEIKSIDIDSGDENSQADYGLDSGGETQLKITTTKGVLQYAVYNAHNGYYGHARILQIFDEIDTDVL